MKKINIIILIFFLLLSLLLYFYNQQNNINNKKIKLENFNINKIKKINIIQTWKNHQIPQKYLPLVN